MTAGPAQPDGGPAPDVLADRCRAFGLPVWRLDHLGAVVTAPAGWGAAQRWLEAPMLRERIVESMRRRDSSRTIEMFTGCWLLPILCPAADGDPHQAAVLALGVEAPGTRAFDDICRSARLDPESARTALSHLGRFDRSNLDLLASAVRGMQDDRVVAAGHDATVGVFSRELALAYEQISLLYKLGRSLNWLTRPHEFMSTACNLLLALLEFEWVAAGFSTTRPPDPDRSTLIVAGELPCPIEPFETQVTKMLHETREDHWRTLHEVEDSELAALVSSQVIAEPVLADRQVAGLLLAGNKVSDDPDVTSIETQLIDATADYLGAFLHNVALYAEQREMFMGTIQALTAAIDAKDRYTRGHSERVAAMGRRLALAFGMTEEEAERVRIAGLVHDVGKIGVPEAVLRKPGRLTDEEFEHIKRHPVIGYHILQDITQLSDVLPGVLYHHERWDGRGYPEGLAGDSIPLMGRLLAVADAFDAMSSDRSYRPAMSRDSVLKEIRACAGTQFDAHLAELFVTLDLTEYDEMVASHQLEDAEAEAA